MLQHSPFRLTEPACLYFWQLPITKKYKLPKYYVGQVVLHRINQPNGEILHPVEVLGLWWNGCDWVYMIEFSTTHPEFKDREREIEEVEEFQLEAI